MISASLLRTAGLFAMTALVFVGCGGRIEAEYRGDASADAGKCGNGTIDVGEQCDGAHLGGATCSSATMNVSPNGQLACSNCRLVTTGCTGSGTAGAGGATGSGGSSMAGRSGTGGLGAGGRLGTGGSVGAGGRGGMSGAPTACTSSGDCSAREVCCGVRTNGQYAFTCAATCARTDTTVACHVRSECGRGETCCGTTNQTGTTYTSIACAATCNGNAERPLCATDADCASGTTCGTSRVLPSAFKVCR